MIPANPSAPFPSSRREAFALLLLVLGLFFRVVRADLAPEILPNFSPLMASALCAAVFLPGVHGLIIPLTALLLSDALLNLHCGGSFLSMQTLWTLPCYVIAVGLGWMLRGSRARLWPILGGTLAASVIFYVVTNTGSWLGLAAYPLTFSGWLQALTAGLPGYPPTWLFFRNSLAGDLLFAAFFVAVERVLSVRRNPVAITA